MSFIGNGHKARPHRAANEFYKVRGETEKYVDTTLYNTFAY